MEKNNNLKKCTSCKKEGLFLDELCFSCYDNNLKKQALINKISSTLWIIVLGSLTAYFIILDSNLKKLFLYTTIIFALINFIFKSVLTIKGYRKR